MNEETKKALGHLKNLNQGLKVSQIYYEAVSTIENALNDYEIQNKILKENNKELIKEQNRLFDIAKEQENELNDLREFVKVLCKMKIVDTNHKIYGINENDIALIKKVVEKYGNQSK